jgi:hypothetical protein
MWRLSVKALLICAIVIFGATSSFAQAPAEAPVRRAAGDQDQLEGRYQTALMETALELAVQRGAHAITRTMQGLGPDAMLISSLPQARGFRLDDYGYFFSVDVPMLKRSLTWTIRELTRPDPALNNSLAELRRYVNTVSDRTQRGNLEQALKRLETEVAPAANAAAASGPAETVAAERAAPSVADDPDAAYTDAVKRALVNTMLETALSIGPDEWLTVAARDASGRLMPGQIYDGITVTLRLKGSDLAAFRAGRITREEARAKVDLREF